MAVLAGEMSKIRINELARELEVKPNRVLELLPEFGVTEKKTHSSSIDEDVAIRLRRHFGLLPPETEPAKPGKFPPLMEKPMSMVLHRLPAEVAEPSRRTNGKGVVRRSTRFQ